MPQVNDRYRIVLDDLRIIIDALAIAQETVEAAKDESDRRYVTDRAEVMAQRLRRKQIDVLLGRIKHLKKRFERALAS